MARVLRIQVTRLLVLITNNMECPQMCFPHPPLVALNVFSHSTEEIDAWLTGQRTQIDATTAAVHVFSILFGFLLWNALRRNRINLGITFT